MAADLTQSFLGKHFEKIVVAVAGAIFIGAVAWFVVMREPQDDLLRTTRNIVEDLEKKSKEKVDLDQAIDPAERMALGIGRPGTTANDIDEAVGAESAPYEIVVKTTPPIYPAKAPEVLARKFFLPATVLPVQEVQTAVGYGVTDADVPRAMAQLQTTTVTYSDIAWAGCVGKFDLTEQLKHYVQPYLDADQEPFFIKQSPIIVARVDLRRRQIRPDGTATDWEDVSPSTSAQDAGLPPPPDDGKDVQAGGQWLQGLLKSQPLVRRTPFYTIVSLGAGQTVQSLADTAEGAAQPDVASFLSRKPSPVPAGPAAAASTGPGAAPPKPAAASADVGPDWLHAGKTGPKPAEGPTVPVAEKEHVYATLWVVDPNVLPGKTYQYQMRVVLANPVWSMENVEPAENRWTLTLEGPWGEPTEPVTVPELASFYFVGTFGERVNLELHRWIHGQWFMVPSAPSRLGGPVVYVKRRAQIAVPGTNETVVQDVSLAPDAFLVDVIRNFPYQPQGRNRPIQTNVLVFADSQGNLDRRVEWEDQERARNDRRIRKEGPAPASGK